MNHRLSQGSLPLLVSIPHMGTAIPAELAEAYEPRALALEDTDWHLDRLYDFAAGMGASVLQAGVSRYVIDLNRPPDDAPMYPGAANTELCPTRFFSGDPLYREGRVPDEAERARRREQYWQPYHEALAGELRRLREQHGQVLLWDAHSIRSHIPWLFEGVLPDLNIGTAAGASAHPAVARAVADAAQAHGGFSHVVDGRFKGGYITRHYGNPAGGVHAVQLEMCQKLYMQELPPFGWDEAAAQRVQPLLQRMVGAALAVVEGLHGR